MSTEVPPKVLPGGGLNQQLLIAVLVGWFCCSCLFNYLAPQLVLLVANQDVTFLELGVTVALGVLSLRLRRLSLLPPPRQMPRWLVVGALHLLGCRAFIWGLQFIPVSLAQTIRASSPMVAVPIAVCALGERYSLRVLAPLAPLVVGFAMSTGADGGGAEARGGCVAAMVSVCCLVSVNAGCKASIAADFRQVQFWTVLAAFLWLLPAWVISGGPTRLLGFEGSWSWLILQVLADGCMYYLEQVAQQFVLRELPLLPFQVIDTLRRLVIVCISGFLVQGNPCSIGNVCGVLLVLGGALAHNALLAREKDEAKPMKTE